MAVETIDFRLNRTAWTARGPSPAIWADCPIQAIQSNPSLGMYFFDDFLSTPPVAEGAMAFYGQYRGFASVGGGVVNADEHGGVRRFFSDGDNEGASLSMASFPFQISRSHKKFWFEARIKVSSIADITGGDVFVGLMTDATLTATLPITATDGVLADTHLIGFHRLATDGDRINTVFRRTGNPLVTVEEDAVAVEANTYVKLGMVYDPSSTSGEHMLSFYADNVELKNKYKVPSSPTGNFPNHVRLGLVAAILNATGTSPGSLFVDWWAAAQLF